MRLVNFLAHMAVSACKDPVDRRQTALHGFAAFDPFVVWQLLEQDIYFCKYTRIYLMGGGAQRIDAARDSLTAAGRACIRSQDLQPAQTRLLQCRSLAVRCGRQELTPDPHALRPTRLQPCRVLFG